MKEKINSNRVNCPRQGCKNEANVDITYGILPCDSCQEQDDLEVLPDSPEFYNLTKIQRVQEQRDRHNKDILQPYLPGKDMKPNPDFVKAYPDKATDYFDRKQLDKM